MSEHITHQAIPELSPEETDKGIPNLVDSMVADTLAEIAVNPNDAALVELDAIVAQSDISQTGAERSSKHYDFPSLHRGSVVITHKLGGVVITRSSRAHATQDIELSPNKFSRTSTAEVSYQEYSDGTKESKAVLETSEGRYTTVTRRGEQAAQTHLEKDSEVIELNDPRTATLITQLAGDAIRRTQAESEKYSQHVSELQTQSQKTYNQPVNKVLRATKTRSREAYERQVRKASRIAKVILS